MATKNAIALAQKLPKLPRLKHLIVSDWMDDGLVSALSRLRQFETILFIKTRNTDQVQIENWLRMEPRLKVMGKLDYASEIPEDFLLHLENLRREWLDR